METFRNLTVSQLGLASRCRHVIELGQELVGRYPNAPLIEDMFSDDEIERLSAEYPDSALAILEGGYAAHARRIAKTQKKGGDIRGEQMRTDFDDYRDAARAFLKGGAILNGLRSKDREHVARGLDLLELKGAPEAATIAEFREGCRGVDWQDPRTRKPTNERQRWWIGALRDSNLLD